jgi:hypothetical protein
MGRGYDWWGFSSGGEYGQFLAKTPQLFAKRAFRLHDMGAQQETMQEDGGPELKKARCVRQCARTSTSANG